MTKTAAKPATASIYRETGTHLLGVGQAVRVKGWFSLPAYLPGIFHITALLPAMGDLPQYRIKNDDERHERVTTQNNLEPVGKSCAANTASHIGQASVRGRETPAKPAPSQRPRTGKYS